LVRLKDLIFHRAAIADLRTKLVAFLTQHREISPSQFKELVGQSRKYSIPLAEYFDAQRVTLRVGDQRRLRG
jgi:selenocysteine-specific elongation factor